MDKCRGETHKIIFRFGKKHQTQKTIYELKNENNETFSTDDDILGEICSFFENSAVIKI